MYRVNIKYQYRYLRIMKYIVTDLETYTDREFKSYSKAMEYADGLIDWVLYQSSKDGFKEVDRS